jgi:hypothetical protein
MNIWFWVKNDFNIWFNNFKNLTKEKNFNKYEIKDEETN